MRAYVRRGERVEIERVRYEEPAFECLGCCDDCLNLDREFAFERQEALRAFLEGMFDFWPVTGPLKAPPRATCT